MLYQISRVFAFGKVKHDELTPFLRWVPILIAVVLSAVFSALPVPPRVFGDGSLSRNMITVFAILPGFYIAALAAVATFNRDEVDFIMPDPAPRLEMRTGPDVSEVELTFRMFISQLFAYLTAISFIAVFVFVSADLVAPSVKYLVNEFLLDSWQYWTVIAIRFSYVMLVSWLAARIVVTTLIGLHFLAERIHRPSA